MIELFCYGDYLSSNAIAISNIVYNTDIYATLFAASIFYYTVESKRTRLLAINPSRSFFI